jgi:hypothetical protein
MKNKTKQKEKKKKKRKRKKRVEYVTAVDIYYISYTYATPHTTHLRQESVAGTYMLMLTRGPRDHAPLRLYNENEVEEKK